MSPGTADDQPDGASSTEPDVMFVLGTRPEIIKIAPIIRACERRGVSAAVLHTGQHYSDSLDTVFFEQLGLDPPASNLEVGSGTHSEQTAAMLSGIATRVTETQPDVLVVQGDTNTTLAGALAGSKLDVEVAHVEAGLRSFDREMPEETNRVVVDHVADYLFPPTDESARLLRKEGLPDDRITVTGNTIVDAVRHYSEVAPEETTVLDDLGLEPGAFFVLTAHRAENVDTESRFEDILLGVERVADRRGTDVVYPIHPRAQKRIDEFQLRVPDCITLVEPLGFLEFLRLEAESALVFTDSGGVQEESCILGTPCVTVRDGTERPETVHVGANCVAGCRPSDIDDAAQAMLGKEPSWTNPFGDGRAAERIVDALGYPAAGAVGGTDAEAAAGADIAGSSSTAPESQQ